MTGTYGTDEFLITCDEIRPLTSLSQILACDATVMSCLLW